MEDVIVLSAAMFIFGVCVGVVYEHHRLTVRFWARLPPMGDVSALKIQLPFVSRTKHERALRVAARELEKQQARTIEIDRAASARFRNLSDKYKAAVGQCTSESDGHRCNQYAGHDIDGYTPHQSCDHDAEKPGRVHFHSWGFE